MSCDDASISTLTQRFRFLDLVQKIARADVDQCVATVGLESLHGMSSLLTSHRTKNHDVVGNEENQQPSHAKKSSRGENVKNSKTSTTTKKTSSHSTEKTNKDKNTKILPQQPQQHSHVHTETHKHHYHYSPNNNKNNISASSEADSTNQPKDKEGAKISSQKPLDAETAATIASRAAHEAAAAVLDEIRLHHQQQQQLQQQQQQQQQNINSINNNKRLHHRHHQNNDPSTITPSRNNNNQQQQQQLRTEETDSSPISFRTDGLVVPASNSKPFNSLPSNIKNNQHSSASKDNNKFETSSVKSDREIAIDAAADRLAKMMMMEEEEENSKPKLQESRSSSIGVQNKPKNDSVLPTSSSVAGANSKRTSPDPVGQEQQQHQQQDDQRQDRKKSPVTFADQQPLPAPPGNNNNSGKNSEQMEKQNNREMLESSRRSASTNSNHRKNDDHLEIDSNTPPADNHKSKNVNGTNNKNNENNRAIIPLHVSAAISDFIDHTDITKRQHLAQQSFSTSSSNKNSNNVLSPEERVALFNEIEDEQQQKRNETQNHNNNNNIFSPNLLISQLDEWLSKHDSFINANVCRHLAEAEQADTKYVQRQKRERESEEEELQKYQQKIWAEELSRGEVDGEILLSGEAERKMKNGDGNDDNEEAKRKNRLFDYPRGHIPSHVCATLREAGKKIPVIVKNWRMQSSLTSSSDLPSEVFCERMAEQMLLNLFNDVGGEVDKLFDEFVEGLVEHELS